jgi:hypothetical protein
MKRYGLLGLLTLVLLLGACNQQGGGGTAPTFTISLNPTSLTIQQGQSGQTTLTLTPQNGFTGSVNLALEDQNGNAPNGITLSPTSVTVSGSSPVTQTLTLSVGTGVATGTYNLRVKATSGSLTKTADLSLEVTAGSSGLSQQEFNQAWNNHTQAQQQALNQLSNDPAFRALVQGPPLGGMGGISPQGLGPQGPLGLLKPLSLIPLQDENNLPRGGYDYTDPQNPQTYTPTSPYDLGLKWRAGNQTAELLVDWDKNGTPTIQAQNRSGQSYETPRKSGANYTLGSQPVGQADFDASWYFCQSRNAYIQEPTNLRFNGSLGQSARLNWDFSYQVTEGAQDTLQSSLTVSTSGTNPTSSVSYQLTLNGDLTRGSDCFMQGFTLQSGSFTFTLQADQDSFAFQINVTQIRWGQNGQPTRVDLNGYVEENNRRALTFSGYLDADDLSGQDTCPGENVTLTFADGSTTLEAWLRSQGYCQP